MPLVAGGIVIAILLGRPLLPHREVACCRPTSAPRPHPRRAVPPRPASTNSASPPTRPSSGSTGRHSTSPTAATSPSLPSPRATAKARVSGLQADDVLVVRGEGEATAALATELGLRLRDDEDGAREIADHLFNRASGLAEVVIPPRSPLVGERLFPGMVTPSGGNLIVLAVQRQSQALNVGEPLAAGDTMLLQGTWAASTCTSPPPRFSS